MQKLQDVCPQLASEFGGDANYCCTEEQIDTLTHQVGHFWLHSFYNWLSCFSVTINKK